MSIVENIFWFRNDLRILDNLPLQSCLKFENVAVIYIYDPEIIESKTFSSMHLDFINDSLSELSSRFQKNQSYLNIFHGNTIKVFEKISKKNKIKNIFSYHDIRDLIVLDIDKSVQNFCNLNRITWNIFQRNGVVRGLKNRDGWAYLWAKEMQKPLAQFPKISKCKKLNGTSGILYADQLGIKPLVYDKKFVGGEKFANLQLDKFLNESGQEYSKHISSPLKAENSCSRLSSYITYGNLSLKQIVKKTKEKQVLLREKKTRDGWLGSLSAFSSRLRWHCHFIQKLEMQPSLENSNMVRAFDAIRNEENRDLFNAWGNGEVGFPMVDACMRFLKFNGWINFRMRAMLVSFASYNLWLDWKKTSKFLSKYFIDYEPGIHYNQFQMQSGVTGINAIRIYNPIKQQSDHDSNGDFVKKWVPELRNVPNDYLQYPHLMSEFLQKKTGCIIGKTYPSPIVDLKTSSLFARKNIFSIKSLAITKKQSKLAYQVHGSRRKIRNGR